MSFGCDNWFSLINPVYNTKTSPHHPGRPQWCKTMKYCLTKLSKTNNYLGETGDLQLDYTLLAGDELYLGRASVTVEPLVYVTFQCDYLHCLKCLR